MEKSIFFNFKTKQVIHQILNGTMTEDYNYIIFLSITYIIYNILYYRQSPLLSADDFA